jgi:hypothetical protein
VVCEERPLICPRLRDGSALVNLRLGAVANGNPAELGWLCDVAGSGRECVQNLRITSGKGLGVRRDRGANRPSPKGAEGASEAYLRTSMTPSSEPGATRSSFVITVIVRSPPGSCLLARSRMSTVAMSTFPTPAIGRALRGRGGGVFRSALEWTGASCGGAFWAHLV